MRIAVSASGASLSSPVDPRFGRSAYIIFLDPETREFEVVENPYAVSASGAGIQSAQLIVKKGAKAVLTGSCGPNAFQVLSNAGVEVVLGVKGTVEQAALDYTSGQLKPSTQSNVSPHFGMGGGLSGSYSAFGMNRGIGRARGQGMSRGMGRGRGSGGRLRKGCYPLHLEKGAPPSRVNETLLSPTQEIEVLKEQAEFLKKQIEKISERIKSLEKTKK